MTLMLAVLCYLAALVVLIAYLAADDPDKPRRR